MSADNYIYVRRRPDGRYGVSHRFASGYYADEGHTVASLQEWYDECNPGEHVIDETWIIPENAEKDIEVYDDPQEAVMAAHRMYEREAIVEYGVQIGDGVLNAAPGFAATSTQSEASAEGNDAEAGAADFTESSQRVLET